MPPPRTPNLGAGSSAGNRALWTSVKVAVTAAEADSVAAAASVVVVVVVVPTARRARALAAVRGCRCTLLWGRWVACGLGRGRGPLRLQGGGSPRGSPKNAADTVSGVVWVCVGVRAWGWVCLVRMREACTAAACTHFAHTHTHAVLLLCRYMLIHPHLH